MNYLYHSVDTASKTWEDRRAGTRPGRLKRIFGQLCKTCENHSQLISILPTDDKYVRLLTGSLSAITQVPHPREPRVLHFLHIRPRRTR